MAKINGNVKWIITTTLVVLSLVVGIVLAWSDSKHVAEEAAKDICEQKEYFNKDFKPKLIEHEKEQEETIGSLKTNQQVILNEVEHINNKIDRNHEELKELIKNGH